MKNEPVVKSNHLVPLQHDQINHVFPQGWCGADPLPCATMENGALINTVWVIPKPVLERLRTDKVALSVVIRGSFERLEMSIVALDVTITNDKKDIPF